MSGYTANDSRNAKFAIWYVPIPYTQKFIQVYTFTLQRGLPVIRCPAADSARKVFYFFYPGYKLCPAKKLPGHSQLQLLTICPSRILGAPV